MSMFDRQQFEASMEAYLDGDLSPADARALEEFADAHAEARQELRRAVLIQRQLRELSTPPCPPDVAPAVLAYARRDAQREALQEARRNARTSPAARLRSLVAATWTTIIRPSLAVGALVALLIGSGMIFRPQPVTAPEQTAESAEEVESALQDAKWAIAYISDIGRRAATSFRDDVLEERVAVPVNQALGAAFNDESHIQ